MDYKNITESILIEIKEVKGIIEKFKNHGTIPQIEIDLTLSKIRNLYDLLLILEKENKIITSPVQRSEQIIKKPAQVFQGSNVENINKIEVNNLDGPVMDIEEGLIEEDPVKNIIENKPEKENIEIIADKFQNTHYRNVAIGEKNQVKDVSAKLQSKPVDDIKRAIGLNDKFMFIKELFDGDSDLYNQTIETINQTENYKEALSYIKANYTWDYKSEEVMCFLEIVKRKFTDN